ncbi:hypothetical protein [Cypionkella sp.]|uniref:hypothetical protein n=1 Tax=Cypionkella sp. TaxID=2811411 RepID=UPI00272A4EB7|nr:hypothetical protein [Cypionkella sp.]
MTRQELKSACLAMLDQNAVEHPAGHQGKLAARYVLRSKVGARIGLMFEKSDKTKPLLWVEHRFLRDLVHDDIEFKVYPASSLYQADEPDEKQSYGRHAALKSMRDLAHVDLVRLTTDRVEQLRTFLTHLATVA